MTNDPPTGRRTHPYESSSPGTSAGREAPRDLERACGALPFLRMLPPEILSRLDSSEFLFPSGPLARAREALEAELGVHVCTYAPDAGKHVLPDRLHLCTILEPASLGSEVLQRLRAEERRFGESGVRLVAYARPLRLRPGTFTLEVDPA